MGAWIGRGLGRLPHSVLRELWAQFLLRHPLAWFEARAVKSGAAWSRVVRAVLRSGWTGAPAGEQGSNRHFARRLRRAPIRALSLRMVTVFGRKTRQTRSPLE